jgi:uncharacterized protein (DUF1501 family)
VLEAILRHPTFYAGPRMVKPPVVYTAGLLRALRRPIRSDSWAWIAELCGQRLFTPPSVAGWDDSRWLDTATFRGRWIAVVEAVKPLALDSEKLRSPHDAAELVERGLTFWGGPTITDGTRAALTSFAEKGLAAGRERWQQKQSHFTSRHFWEVGATRADLRTGWLGRYLDRVGDADNPLQGLSLDGALQPSLATAKVPVAAVSAPDDYGFWAPGVWGDVNDRLLDALGSFPGGSDPALRQAAAVAAQSDRLRRQLSSFARVDDKPSFTSPVPYPKADDDFPKRLAGLAAMIAAGLPLRCVAIEAPGHYDTHSDQAGMLSSGIQLTGSSLLAFQRDLEARGVADRVLTLVWSEFGRRAKENGSAGTDHGAAGAAFVLGARASGITLGEFPGLATGLDRDGNLLPTTDYRGLYASLVEQWLGADADAVIPGARAFKRLKVVR